MDIARLSVHVMHDAPGALGRSDLDRAAVHALAYSVVLLIS